MEQTKTLWKSRTTKNGEISSSAALGDTNNANGNQMLAGNGASPSPGALPGAFPVFSGGRRTPNESDAIEMIEDEADLLDETTLLDATTTVVISKSPTVLSADLVDEEAARQRGQALAELERYRNITAFAVSVHGTPSRNSNKPRCITAAALCLVIFAAVVGVITIPLLVFNSNNHDDETFHHDNNNVNNSTK